MTTCGPRIRLSKHVHIFRKGGAVALMHALNMSKVYGSERLLRLYDTCRQPVAREETTQFLPHELFEQFILKGFLVEADVDEEQLPENLKQAVGRFNIKNLVLLVSNNCNFRCSYCQIEENMKPEHMINMPGEVAGRAIDLFQRNSRPEVKKTVTITGGEPLLNMDVVNLIIERVKAQLENARIVVFTNGSLVTEELARHFRDNDVLVLVSLDGPQPMHDAVRKYRGGRGTFDAAMNGYRMLKEAGCNVGISAVGGVHNIADLDRTFEFFTELSPPSIGFNFSHFLLDKDNPTEIPIADFGRILLRFYEILRERNIFLENISRPISAFANNTPKINECQAQGQGFTVDARGMIGPCKSLVVSDVFSEDMDKVDRLDEHPLFQDWATRSPLNDEECIECPAITICGGGCAYDSYIANQGEFKKIDKRVCEYELKILDYLIWDLFDNIKDKVGSEGIYFPSVEEQLEAFQRFYDAGNALQRSVGHENEK